MAPQQRRHLASPAEIRADLFLDLLDLIERSLREDLVRLGRPRIAPQRAQALAKARDGGLRRAKLLVVRDRHGVTSCVMAFSSNGRSASGSSRLNRAMESSYALDDERRAY
jgi:hypothetical protein